MNTYRVLDVQKLSEHTVKIKTERPSIEIRAGQCFNLGIPGMGINREYSMCSSETSPFLEFLVRVVSEGLVSTRLATLAVGDALEIDGPYGEFCLPHQFDKRDYLFIASGTGIAPFISFVKTHPEIQYQVWHGIRYNEERYGQKDFRADCYIPCISSNSDGKSLRVTDHIEKNIPHSETMIYLCGNRNMIVEMVDKLISFKIPTDQIIVEAFF